MVQAPRETTSSDRSVGIVGAGLGGLSAAIHLRLAGRDVRVFEANDRPGGRANLIESDGFRFDTGPSLLNYPWVFDELFASAGRDFRDYVPLLPVDPSVSFQWRDGTRLTLSSDVARLLESCERVEPGCGSGLMRFLRDARAKYDLAFKKLVNRNADSVFAWMGRLRPNEMLRLSIWRSLYGELGRFFRSRHIREALGAYGMYLGGSPFRLPGFFSILAYGELAYGLWLPKGGVYGLVEGMTRLARELGVEIVTGRRVSRIDTGNGRVTGLSFADGSREVFPTVVSNVDVPTTDLNLLAHEPAVESRRRRARRTVMTPGVLTFYWGIRGKVENLGHHTIFLPDDYRSAFDDLMHRGRMPADLPFYVSVPSETDPALAPEGGTTMFVLVPTPVLSKLNGTDWQRETARVRAHVLDRLRRHDVAISESDIAVEHVYTPVDWQERFGLHDGSAFGAAHTLFQLGPFRAANVAPELPGMYYTGAGVPPGTGMPMVVIGGRLTAERIVGGGS